MLTKTTVTTILNYIENDFDKQFKRFFKECRILNKNLENMVSLIPVKEVNDFLELLDSTMPNDEILC